MKNWPPGIYGHSFLPSWAHACVDPALWGMGMGISEKVPEAAGRQQLFPGTCMEEVGLDPEFTKFGFC